jgi:hypothetical protein
MIDTAQIRALITVHFDALSKNSWILFTQFRFSNGHSPAVACDGYLMGEHQCCASFARFNFK